MFQTEKEGIRKDNLKKLEDRRMEFAQKLQARGFAPQDMVLISGDKGGLYGLSRENGKTALIIGPDFGTDGDFILEEYDDFPATVESFFVPGEGLGGMLGMGTKGQIGYIIRVRREEGELELPIVANRNCATLFTKGKNPLLNPKRRRGNANVVWDLMPLEKRSVQKIGAYVCNMLGLPIPD